MCRNLPELNRSEEAELACDIAPPGPRPVVLAAFLSCLFKDIDLFRINHMKLPMLSHFLPTKLSISHASTQNKFL